MFSSLEAEGQWPWDLVCSIGDVGPTRFAQVINLGWPWPSLWQGQIWFLMHLFGKNLVLSTNCQADLWPFIKGHSFGLPHTYLNICFSEITWLFDGLFIRLFKSLDQNVCNPHIWQNKICSIICCSWPWPILTLLRRSGERLRTFRSSSCICLDGAFMGRSTPTTAFDGAIWYFAYSIYTHWTYAWRSLVQKK